MSAFLNWKSSILTSEIFVHLFKVAKELMMPGKKEFDVKFWVTDNLIAYSLLSKSSDSVIYVINAIRKSFDYKLNLLKFNEDSSKSLCRAI